MHSDIRAVIFDFGNVIAKFSVDQFLLNIQPFSEYSIGKLRALLPRLSQISIAYESGQVTSDQFCEQMCAETRLTIEREQFVNAYTSIFTPIVKIEQLIHRLNSRYSLALLSNTNPLHYEAVIRTHPVFQLFESVTLSFEVGAMKPDIRIYQSALSSLNIPPGQCIYIDDIREYADAAGTVGIHGIHYINHSQLLRRLRTLGVTGE